MGLRGGALTAWALWALVACGGEEPAAPTLTLRFGVSEGVRESPNLVDELRGAVYGSIFRRAEVTVTGPQEDAEAVLDLEVTGVDVREDEVSAASWEAALPAPDLYVFLGFFDVDGNGEVERDPEAGDPVTLPFANDFEVEEGVSVELTAQFDLVLN